MYIHIHIFSMYIYFYIIYISLIWVFFIIFLIYTSLHNIAHFSDMTSREIPIEIIGEIEDDASEKENISELADTLNSFVNSGIKWHNVKRSSELRNQKYTFEWFYFTILTKHACLNINIYDMTARLVFLHKLAYFLVSKQKA